MSTFPPDFAVEFDQQIYRPIGSRQHVTRDGRQTTLIQWLTHCPSCGSEFTISTNMLFSAPRRRCDDCKSPNRQVATDRKTFLTTTL
jgi:Zn finger protein HypA/HybF involved in hydrogenase expression